VIVHRIKLQDKRSRLAGSTGVHFRFREQAGARITLALTFAADEHEH